MSLPVILRPEAEADIQATHDELEQVQTGLGVRFVARIQELLERIEAMPEMHGVIWQDVRAARLKKFRHLVYYVVFPDRAELLAVMHGSRDASAWQARVWGGFRMEQGPQLGQLIDDGDRRRDAIHIAVAPVTAAERLLPGQHVGLVQEGSTELVGPCDQNIGVVDPFLTEDVEPGQRFWLFLYPGTITSLRHIWTHPAFAAAAAAVKEKVL